MANRSVLKCEGQDSAHIEMREKHKLTNVKNSAQDTTSNIFRIFFPNMDHYIDCGRSLENYLSKRNYGLRYHGNHPALPLHSPSAQPLLEICVSEKGEDKCRPNDHITEPITSMNRN